MRPISSFTKDRRRPDGLAFYCRDHARTRMRESRLRRLGPPQTRRLQDQIVPAGYKWCPDCDTVKPIEEFPKTRANKSGRHTYCLPCHNARGRATLEKKGGSRTYHLQRRYGISADDADAMLEAQGGLCAVCESAPAVHVDHDHVTGAVRALLCFNCNGGLGQFKDDPDVLRAAADYVEFHRARRTGANGPTAPTRPGVPPVGSKAGPNRRRLHPRACAPVRAKYELREADE